MKKVFLLSVFFSFLFLYGFAENILVLTNPKTQETHVFRKGSYLVFELKEDKSVREGFIGEIADSSISFKNILFEGHVSLSQMTILAGSTRAKVVAGKVMDAVCKSLIVSGSAVFDCGFQVLTGSDYYYWPIGGTISLAGGLLFGMGHLLDLATYPFDYVVSIRNYKNWHARIIHEQQAVNGKCNLSKPDHANPDDDVYGD